MEINMTTGFEEQMMNNILSIGDIVGDTNRMVIAQTKKAERIPGDSYASWIAICVKGTEYHPYAVWDVVASPKGFMAYHGNYCMTLEEALIYYKERGGK
jgi:hypothetical protein